MCACHPVFSPCRREQQAAAASTALQAQLNQQQLMLEAQQQQLAGMQEQLAQLKDMHKKKLARYKMQLQQQYESQLAAATTAYTQELSLVHVSAPTRTLADCVLAALEAELQLCRSTACLVVTHPTRSLLAVLFATCD